MQDNWEKILDLLRKEDRFLVAAHSNPDGDALGSTAAMGWVLEALGKQYWLYNASPLPVRFAWISLSQTLHCDPPPWEPRWYILLDCGDVHRIGKDAAIQLPADRTVNIDHHVSNAGFGGLNLVEAGRSSVGEIIGYLAMDLGISLHGPLGEAIYLAMSTDTGSFSFESTSPECLELAAEVIRQGLNPGIFNARMQNQWRLNRLHLMGEVLRRARLFSKGRIGIVSISAEMRKKTNATIEDCDDVVDYIRRVKGIEVAVSLREDEPKKIKFSLRSFGDTDVGAMAAAVGGGGHKNASGGELPYSLDEAEEFLIRLVDKHLAMADQKRASTFA
ncbi:MAG TPA: bifunctional oligoribonuclease/PAP phosphatase NrnA [Desulfonatronum sp.]|nr:bifunctional oligoribonuclease/PAP phosphatase NrnA [Desulfonatronum sp.]